VVEEVEMSSPVLKPFLLGVTLGMGIVVLSLYTRKPGRLVTSLEKIGELGRARRAKEEEKKRERKWLKAVGFSDKEIDEVF
jgi:hypothetical protein